MTDERALCGFKNLLNDLDKDNGLFVGTINPEIIKVAICAIENKIKADKKREVSCDRNICVSNEYNGIGCDECVVNKENEECISL